MTVLEPTPERASRATFVRRIGFAATALVLVAAFALALSSIAATEGTLRPDGQAAGLAAKQRSAPAARAHDCPRDRDRNRDRGASGRV